MDRSSLVRSSSWQELQIGQKVVFAVKHGDKGPHASELEPDSKPDHGDTSLTVLTENEDDSVPGVE